MPHDLPVPGTSKCIICGKSRYRDESDVSRGRGRKTIDDGCLVVWDDMPL